MPPMPLQAGKPPLRWESDASPPVAGIRVVFLDM